MTVRPRVVIAEDDFLILEDAIIPALTPDFEIVATVGDGKAAVAAVEEHRPDAILLDVSLPLLRGFDAARIIQTNKPECTILFVSNYWETAYIETAREMGAGGYVFKSRVRTELARALRAALSGEFYCSTA